jgi:hypothetical protein
VRGQTSRCDDRANGLVAPQIPNGNPVAIRGVRSG